MPLYDFKCKDCGKSFELSLTLVEREAETDKKICPSCASKHIEQELTTGGIFASSLKTIQSQPPCMAGGCCPTGSCPWEKD